MQPNTPVFQFPVWASKPANQHRGKPMSQTTQILNHMKRHGAITPLEALDKYQCFRLAARIHDLRGSGYDIETRTIHKNNKEFAEYALRRAR